MAYRDASQLVVRLNQIEAQRIRELSKAHQVSASELVRTWLNATYEREKGVR
jgi:hypothetical protein